MKRIISIFLVVLMLLTAAPLTGFVGMGIAPKAVASGLTGQCGESVFWSLDESTGVITIYGPGEMSDYKHKYYEGSWRTDAPWWQYHEMIKKVVIENEVTSVGVAAFASCRSITDVLVGNGVTLIDGRAFENCSSLTNLIIPDSVTSINDYAFRNCSSLTSVTIPDSITWIGWEAFDNCTALKRVNITNLEAWCNISFGTVYSNPLYFANNLYVNGELVRSLTIPNSVTIISGSTFLNCLSLSSVTIPNGVIKIGGATFSGCTLLNSLTISKSVTSIGIKAFEQCINLKNVYYDGTKSQWAEIAISSYNECLMNATIHCTDGTIIGGVVEEFRFPIDYDFYKDSFNFSLVGAEIQKSYFSNMFEPGAALLQYLKYHDAKDGMCFGFAYATALLYNRLPNISYFRNSDSSVPRKIRDLSLDSVLVLDDTSPEELLNLESKKVEKTFTLKDLIIYSFIYQGTSKNGSSRKSSKNDLRGLYNAVKNCIETNEVQVTITFEPKLIGKLKHKAGHEVLAVGLHGNNILVDEPNAPNSFQELIIEGESWHYGPPGQEYWLNSEEYNISYTTDFNRVYEELTGINASHSKKSSSNIIDYSNIHETANLLISIEADDFELDDNNAFEVWAIDGEDDEKANRLFWVIDSTDVQVSNIEKGGIVSAAVGESVMSAKADSKADIIIINEEEKPNLLVNTRKGSEVFLELSKVDEALNDYKVAITGTANAGQIQASKTETGYTVSGLNDIFIEYIENNKVINDLSSNITDGRKVCITVDYDEKAVLTDLESIHSHLDTDNDGHCDTCGEQMTGGDHCAYCGKIHDGFFGWLVRFFHKIFALFKR